VNPVLPELKNKNKTLLKGKESCPLTGMGSEFAGGVEEK
jgi:hypothetical protein